MGKGRYVDTIVRPPEAPPKDPVASANRPRRWPRRAAGIVALLPFAAFRLDPKQEAIIEMEADVAANACVEGPGSTSWFQEPITYTIFGITRHSLVETGTEIRLVGAPRTRRVLTVVGNASGTSGRRRSRLGRPDCRS